ERFVKFLAPELPFLGKVVALGVVAAHVVALVASAEWIKIVLLDDGRLSGVTGIFGVRKTDVVKMVPVLVHVPPSVRLGGNVAFRRAEELQGIPLVNISI